MARFNRISVAHMDADFPEVSTTFINDSTRPERASDHDAPVAYFNLTLAPTARRRSCERQAHRSQWSSACRRGGKSFRNAESQVHYECERRISFRECRDRPASTPSVRRLSNFEFSPAERSFTQIGNNTSASFTGCARREATRTQSTRRNILCANTISIFWDANPMKADSTSGAIKCSIAASMSVARERRLINVSAAYFQSIEFQLTGGLVDRTLPREFRSRAAVCGVHARCENNR